MEPYRQSGKRTNIQQYQAKCDKSVPRSVENVFLMEVLLTSLGIEQKRAYRTINECKMVNKLAKITVKVLIEHAENQAMSQL